MTASSWKAFYAGERAELGRRALLEMLDRAPPAALPAAGALVFPHTRLTSSGELVASAVKALLDCGCDRVLALGVLHGARSYLLQDEDGQVMETHSISAGLDYPGVGPEHGYLKDSGRAVYVGVDDAGRAVARELHVQDQGRDLPDDRRGDRLVEVLRPPGRVGPAGQDEVPLAHPQLERRAAGPLVLQLGDELPGVGVCLRGAGDVL